MGEAARNPIRCRRLCLDWPVRMEGESKKTCAMPYGGVGRRWMVLCSSQSVSCVVMVCCCCGGGGRLKAGQKGREFKGNFQSLDEGEAVRKS